MRGFFKFWTPETRNAGVASCGTEQIHVNIRFSAAAKKKHRMIESAVCDGKKNKNIVIRLNSGFGTGVIGVIRPQKKKERNDVRETEKRKPLPSHITVHHMAGRGIDRLGIAAQRWRMSEGGSVAKTHGPCCRASTCRSSTGTLHLRPSQSARPSASFK
ncbi:hypothetical protein BJV78DRAFT_754432 [Lactifluus subvellereus]|nr:hypothetical protein BJV78DRAFT_754432 [Lactifluus subvellereus]